MNYMLSVSMVACVVVSLSSDPMVVVLVSIGVSCIAASLSVDPMLWCIPRGVVCEPCRALIVGSPAARGRFFASFSASVAFLHHTVWKAK